MDILFLFCKFLAASVVEVLMDFFLLTKNSRFLQSFATDMPPAYRLNAPALPEHTKKEYSRECSFFRICGRHQYMYHQR